MTILYHGSNTQGLKTLTPNISLELKSRIYATEDIAYALARAGKQIDLIREEYNGKNGIFELAECYPKAFKKTFECSGSVYLLKSKYFHLNPDDTDEYISEEEVPVRYEMKLDNVWTWIKELDNKRFKLVRYGTDEWREYWSLVRGGLDGYLKRKKQRKEKMMEMRAK